MTHRDLRVLDATNRAIDQVNQLIDRPSGRRMLHVWQLRDSAESIGANIAEGFGREEGRDRRRILRIARSEAEETIHHLGTNFRANRIPAKDYWSLHNRLVVIVKMLNALVYR